MNYPAIITLLLSCVFALPAHANETPKPVPPGELAWFYTLAVQRDSENCSFSLMKEGWLAFDTWGDGKEIEEKRIDLPADQFTALKAKFGKLFDDIQKAEEKKAGDQPTYAFERGTDSVATLEFSGKHPNIEKFLVELSRISGKALPFLLNEAESDSNGDH